MSAPIPTPRPSASLVVVNEFNEILLVHRNPKATAFGGMHVFPGGNFDKKQDPSMEMTAIRETFEESGLLLATPSASTPPTALSNQLLDEARHSIHQQKQDFRTFLQTNHLQPDTQSLLRFTQWITPVGPPKRFHTQFFVAFLPAAPSTGFTSGHKHDRLPTHDGGQEVIEARFVHPRQALEECKSGKISVMPPQFYIMSTLADILDGPENTPAQRQRVETLSKGLFGQMVINPRPLGKDEKGRSILTYEGDETRGGSKGRLHRAVLRMEKGRTIEISLLRNFDIFSEIETQAPSPSRL